MSASAATSIAMGKAAAIPTVNVSATNAAGAAPVGGATAEVAAGAGVAAEERTGSTEEAEVRKLPYLLTTNNNSTRDQTLSAQSNCAFVMQTRCWRHPGFVAEKRLNGVLDLAVFCYFLLNCQSLLLGIVSDKEQCGQLCNHINGDLTTWAGTGLITLKVDLHLCVWHDERSSYFLKRYSLKGLNLFQYSTVILIHVLLKRPYFFNRLQVKV